MPKITFKVSPDGAEIKTEAFEFTGGRCEELTDAIMRGTTGEVTSRTYKDEYYQDVALVGMVER